MWVVSLLKKVEDAIAGGYYLQFYIFKTCKGQRIYSRQVGDKDEISVRDRKEG